MELNERFLENEQNISALKILRTGVSVLVLICMWISLLGCGTVRIMDVKMAAYEMKAMPSAVEAEKGILTAGRCYPAWEKMKDSMLTDKKILPAVSQTLETAEAGIEKNVTEKSDSRLTKTVTADTGDAGIIKKVVTGKKNTEVSLPAEIVPPATDDSNLIENDSEKPEMMLVTEDGFIVDGTGTITGVADYEKAVKEGRLTLPSSDQCSQKIAATTFTDAPDGILEIVIPANIIFIEEGTFADLKDVEWYETEPDNPVYVSRDGVLFSEQRPAFSHFLQEEQGFIQFLKMWCVWQRMLSVKADCSK
ncbi:hypothetical protein [[Ruminococcus] lactaris]|uniref:hypothetical protein n=1 Tax=[Ruminococcus] lactaris TaxID=46228 RepID=UPI003520D033